MYKKIILLCITISIFFLGGILLFMSQTTYSLHIPSIKEVESISISNTKKQIEIEEQKEIEDIIYILKGNDRTTKKESVNDTPVNVDEFIKIELKTNTKANTKTTLYYYEIHTRHYLEQPYNGIYQISGDEYNGIAKYLH